MPFGQRKWRKCIGCLRTMYGFKEYCSNACRQMCYRDRKRGKLPRHYRKPVKSDLTPQRSLLD